MAKLQPDGSLSGSLGGATYAKQPDGTTNVRSKGGVTRDKVMKSLGMARTRENFHDFGRASGSAKVIRLCLREMIKGHKLADPILSGGSTVPAPGFCGATRRMRGVPGLWGREICAC